MDIRFDNLVVGNLLCKKFDTEVNGRKPRYIIKHIIQKAERFEFHVLDEKAYEFQIQEDDAEIPPEIVISGAGGDIEAAWEHARFASLEILGKVLEERKAKRGEKWKNGVLHVMGANTTTPDQAGRKVSNNYDDEIVEKMKQYDVVIWDGDYIHPTSFTRPFLALMDTDWDGILIALQMHWIMEPKLADQHWEDLCAKGKGRVKYVTIKSPTLPGRQPWNRETDAKGFAPWGLFSGVLNNINSWGFANSSSTHCLVLGGGHVTKIQMEAQLRRGVNMDVYAVARYQDDYATWDQEGVLDWLYRASTQDKACEVKVDNDKEAMCVGGKICTFRPEGCSGVVSLHYRDDWWSVAGTAKAGRVMQALTRGMSLDQAVIEAEREYTTQFGIQPTSEWGRGSPSQKSFDKPA